VEFKDYVMLLEAGQSEARGLAYVAEIKKLVPNKPIRYVWTSHPHSDHTGGLPVLVADGATIITQKNNEKFLESALNTPRTLMTDTLAKNPKKAKFETIGEKKVYSDGTRTVEFYHVFSGAPLERPDDRLHPEGQDSLPGRLHGDAGRTGQRSRQGARLCAREAQPRLRPLHPGPRRGCSAE
jgi:Metallo-beta-lactamase superfamily